MKAIQLRPYQIKAMDAIQAALDSGQKTIVVEMVAGSGKGLVLAKTVEILHKHKTARILIVTSRIELKENVEHNLFDRYKEFVLIDKDRVTVTTEQRILRHANKDLNEYQFIIFDEADISESIYKVLACKEKTIVVFL